MRAAEAAERAADASERTAWVAVVPPTRRGADEGGGIG